MFFFDKFLKKKSYSREILSQLYEIVFRVYEIPLVVLFRYGGFLLISSPNYVACVFWHLAATSVVVVVAELVCCATLVNRPAVSR